MELIESIDHLRNRGGPSPGNVLLLVSSYCCLPFHYKASVAMESNISRIIMCAAMETPEAV